MSRESNNVTEQSLAIVRFETPSLHQSTTREDVLTTKTPPTVTTNADDNGFFQDSPTKEKNKGWIKSRGPRVEYQKSRLKWFWYLMWLLSPYRLIFLVIGGCYILISTGGAAYLWNEFQELPVLETDVERLESEVDEYNELNQELEAHVNELEAQVKILEDENVIFEAENEKFQLENDKLAAENEEYSRLNEELNATQMQLEQINEDLNKTINEIGNEVDDLREENLRLFANNQQLNNTVIELEDQIVEIGSLNDLLEASVEELDEINANTQKTIDEIQEVNSSLNSTAKTLESEVNDLIALNDYRHELNQNLSELVIFLNDTANETNTFDDIIADLDSKINTDRMLDGKDIELKSEEKLIGWRCSFYATRQGISWVENPLESIDSLVYDDNLKIIEDLTLSEICANFTDFELYLEEQNFDVIYPTEMTLARVSSGVNKYSELILYYYYPQIDGENNTITLMEWAEANYDCTNLPNTSANNRRYSYFYPSERPLSSEEQKIEELFGAD